MDPDQLASTLFTRELKSACFYTVFERVYCLRTERYRLICSFGLVKFFSMDKYIMVIYLSLVK